MKVILFLISSLAILLLSSCGVANVKTSSVPADNIKKLSYFSPIAHINYVKKGNRAIYNDSLSKLAELRMDSVISHSGDINIVKKINISDTLYQTFKTEVRTSLVSMHFSKNIEEVTIPSTIDSLLDAHDMRFGLVTFISGIERRKGNYFWQVLKAVGIGVVTLGLYVPVPIKKSASMYVAVFDSSEDNAAYYRRTLRESMKPTNRYWMEEVFEWVFENYLYDKNPYR